MPKFDPHGWSRRSPNTDLARRDDAERSDQFRCAVPTYLGDDLCLPHVRQPRKAKQDHPGVHEALPEDQLAEVFVRSQQNGAARWPVAGPPHLQYWEPARPRRRRHDPPRVAAPPLRGRHLHRRPGSRGFCTDGVDDFSPKCLSGESEGSQHSLARQAGVGFEHRLDGFATATDRAPSDTRGKRRRGRAWRERIRPSP